MSASSYSNFGFCEKFVDALRLPKGCAGFRRTLTRSRLRAYAERPGGNFKAFQDGFWILDLKGKKDKGKEKNHSFNLLATFTRSL
ncbi:hypothetical protein BLD44_002525 [Mastigocladus laminosus UU774]|nr:hypothetical protein BLD44_002525 [Mastigocladus laminosus UU774]